MNTDNSRVQSLLTQCEMIDWVVSWPYDISGHVAEQFYRGEILSVEWNRGVPAILLNRVWRYLLKSKRWSRCRNVPRDFFNFNEIRSRHVDFAFEALSNNRIRFNIALTITGMMFPRHRAGKHHLFARTEKNWEEEAERLLRSLKPS